MIRRILTFGRLRYWTLRTALKMIRERVGIRFWARFLRMLWRTRGSYALRCVAAPRFALELDVRRRLRVFGPQAELSSRRSFDAALRLESDDDGRRLLIEARRALEDAGV